MGRSIVILIIVAIVVIFVLAFFIRFLRRRRAALTQQSDNQQLYVGNLSYRVHERDLHRFFSRYGEITHLKIVKDRESRRSKGFGFVTFSSSREAKKALAAHGETMSGRNIVVRLAKPR